MATAPRLFVKAELAEGAEVALGRDQAHYLARVLRLGPGDPVRLFNGRDGEWSARLVDIGKAAAGLRAERRLREQRSPPDVWLLFAPLKRTPTDLVVQKATELGAARIVPVMTTRTVADRVNLDRLRAIVAEAAEQCERLEVPEVGEPVGLKPLLAGWDARRSLLVCDETGAGESIASALTKATPGRWALLLGPEGGFAPAELDALSILPFVCRASLGPRILRAETAAVAALALWQSLLGDWADPPPRRPRDED